MNEVGKKEGSSWVSIFQGRTAQRWSKILVRSTVQIPPVVGLFSQSISKVCPLKVPRCMYNTPVLFTLLAAQLLGEYKFNRRRIHKKSKPYCLKYRAQPFIVSPKLLMKIALTEGLQRSTKKSQKQMFQFSKPYGSSYS